MEKSDDKIQLFIRIATKLAINFPDKKNRIKAIKWIKKIQDEKNSNVKNIKFHAIQLLLCCLQRNLLVGPFENTPNDKTKLNQYNWSYQPNDIAKLILEHEFDKCGKPPIKIEISGDLTEFVSYQEIPNFGAHFFYAYSPEDIKKWDNLDKSVIPKGLLNITEFESPDDSILVETIQKNYEERQESKKKVHKKRVEEDERTQQDFQDVTVIDENTAKIRDSFIDQVPVAKDAVPTDTLKEVIGSGMVKHDDIALDPLIAKEGVKIKGPHLEKITVTKDGKKVVQKKKVKKVASKQEATKLEDEIKELERKRDAEKAAILEKMPTKIRERLQRQYAPTQEEKDLRTPEIFRKTQTRHPSQKYRIYKPEEFGLKPDEKFVPATEFVKGLEYKPPAKKIRRSPVPKEAYSRTLRLGSRQAEPLISSGKRKQEEITNDVSPLSKDVRLSWERSWEKRKKSRLEEPQIPPVQQETQRRDILERLKAIKRSQPRRIDLDESVDVDVTPVEIDYEPFVYQELPESEYEPSILLDDQMQTEDLFGEEAIAYPYKTPAGPSVGILEQDDILQEKDMQTDDLFTGENIIDPRMLRKRSPMDRIVSHLPVEQIDDIVFDESVHGADSVGYPSLYVDSRFNCFLDRRAQQISPEHYGPWAERFRRQMERLERGESSIVSDEDSGLLQEDEMELGDMFEPETPEMIRKIRQERLAEQLKRMQDLKWKWLTYKDQLKRAPRPLEADEDLLEPAFYRTPVYEPPGIMDSSIAVSELPGLQAPLISGIDIVKKNILEDYEEQLNNSLQLLYGQVDMPPKTGQKVKVFEDPDFLERRIFEIPAESSIISESEMAQDAFDEFIDEESSMKEGVYIEDESFPSIMNSTPIRNIEHLGRKLDFHSLPDERLEDISMPDDELAMSAALLETEMEEDEAAQTEQRFGRDIGAELKRLKERMQVVREHRLQRERPPVISKKPAKIYRGPMGSPGIPDVPGTSNLRGVQWESFEKQSAGSPARMKILEQALKEEVNRKILQKQMDTFSSLEDSSLGDSLIDDAEMEDLFGEDEIEEPIPMHKIPMPTRTPPSRVQPYYDTITERLDEQSLPSEMDTLESDSMIEDYDEGELLEDESFPSESMAYFEMEPLSDADIQAAKWDYLRKMRQLRSGSKRKIGLSPIAEVHDEEDDFNLSSHFDAKTRRAFAKSILASKRLQQLKQKLRERKGLPPADEEEIKDALHELYKRQRIIDNMGLMDKEIQEKITQKPLIEEPTLVQPLNVIEEYDRDMKFITKAREDYKRRRDIEKEAAKIAADIEKDAILAQQVEDDIIKDIEDLDWEVEEPVPVSKLPMPHIEKKTDEIEDLEQISIPEDISYESAEEDEVPVYTREQFEREFEEEQRQRRELQSILAQQTTVDSAVQQPFQRQSEGADRPEVSEEARKEWDKLRQIRQLRSGRRRRIGLSPIAEVQDDGSFHHVTPTTHFKETDSEDLGVLDIDKLLPGDIFAQEDIETPAAIKGADVRSVIARSISASKRLQQLKQKLRERKGLPPTDEEEYKDALQELYERQRMIDNTGLMDQEIQEKITQRPLIEKPKKPPNVIEEYDRDMKFITKAREDYKRRRDIEKEAAKIAADIEKDAILAQQVEDDIIKDIEDLDWEVEEPVPVSKLPMPHIEKKTDEIEDLEQISIPEDISYESAEEDEVPVYTREQFEREFEEEQRQRRELQSILAQQTTVDSAVQQPFQRQSEGADRTEVSEEARKEWDKLRQIRQLRSGRRRRIGLSPIEEALGEEDSSQMSGLMEQLDESHESYGEDPFASFEPNIDYYTVQELGDKLDAGAPPLTAAEMADFDEEDVERPSPMHIIPMPQPPPAKDYFIKMEQVIKEEDLMEEISEPEEIEEADEFYGVTDEYGRPLSPTRITLAKSVRQSMVTTDLIHRYRQMKGLPAIDLFPKLPYIHQYLEHEQDLLEPMTPGVVQIEETLLDESLPETELPPALVGLPKAPMNVIEKYEQQLGKYPRYQQFSPESLDILSESILDETFGDTATPTRMKDIPMPSRPSQITSPTRIAQPIQSPLRTPRRPQRSSPSKRQLFEDARLPRRPVSLEERFDFISQIAMPQRHELVGVRPHEYAPLQFFERPVADELNFLEKETFPDDNLHLEIESTEFGDLYRAVYIPTEAEEREIEEALKRQRISPPSMAPQSRNSYRRTASAGSPIGKTWISPGEEGFKWLDNYIPSEEPKARKARKSRRVTFAAEPRQAYFEPSASASEIHILQPPRVAGLVNPRLARAKEQSHSIPQGPRKISKTPPRVAFLQHPRTKRTEAPQSLPTVPKKILRALPRVASLPPRGQYVPVTRPSQPLPPSMKNRGPPHPSGQTGSARKKKVVFKE